MDMATDAPLLMADAAIALFLAVHPDAYPGVLETGLVSRRTYAATRKTYIGLRENRDDAVDRAMKLFDKGPTLRHGPAEKLLLTIAQERMVLKKLGLLQLAIVLDFTKLRRVHNCP